MIISQKTFFDFSQPDNSVSKVVRNRSLVDNQDIFCCQRDIVRRVLLGHPEGITDQEVSDFTGFPLSAVNGRRNELDAVVVGLAVYEDENGRCHCRCMWGLEV